MFKIDSHTGGFTGTNSFLLSHENGSNVLIDASKGVADWLDSNEVRVEALLLTHQHFDHVMDAAAVAERQNCPIFAFAPASRDLTLIEMMTGIGLPIEVADFEVAEVLEGQSELELGPFRFEILHVPGHSPDSICFQPEGETDREQKVLIGGDVLFQRGIGRTDFPHSDPEQLLAGIREKLYVLPPETLVFPGHGPWTSIGEERVGNPFVIAD